MADWQNLDPEAAREAEKYENPIPSRELILQRLDERGAPASREQLVEEFGLTTDEQLEALRRRLRAMERDGQLIYTRRGTYAPVDKLDLICGRVSGHRDGFGFLIPDDGSDDLFLSPAQMRLVFDGDRALARVSGLDRRGRREGALVEIIGRAHETLVGRFFEESGIARVVADNPKIQQEVLVPAGKQGAAKHGQFVQVKIEQWPSNFRLAQGEVVEVLGDYMAPGMEIEVALRSYDIPHEWPAAVLKEAAKLKPEVAEKDKEKRIDLRDLALVTIDGEDARDFDDAVYAEARKGGGWRLIVAIADVSHYVKVGSALDEEATNRGNSVYFPEKVIPMLPEVLSNGLCSLNPLVDRLAMVCDMTLSRAGKLTGYEFYEAVIHSHARLTYTKVSQFLETPDSTEAKLFAEQLPHLVTPLQQLYKLYKVLLAARQVRGAIDFETQETRIVFGADRKISEILPTQRNDAHKLIEECMLCANVATARFLMQHEIPALYRVHEGPPSERLDKLRQFLAELGLTLNRGKSEPTPSDYQALLETIRERPDYHLIQTVMLRSLSQAVYSPDNEGHFGLNYDAYTHFTSPIRRYPDLLVHRAIRGLIRSKRESAHVRRAGAAAMPKARIYPYDEARLAQLGEQCSMTERRADEATRDVTNWLKCEYMRDRVGETFPGVISAVTGFGIFVELIDIYVEGLVHVTALPGDYYHFDPIHHRLSGERSGRSFRLGDTVEVVVARVDLDERKIDFELSDNVLSAPVGRKNRGTDKSVPVKGRAKAAEPKVGKGRSRGAKGAARHAQQDTPQQEPRAAVAPRRQRAGKVQALPAVSPEMLAQAEELLGNTDVSKSRAMKQALLSEARQGAKATKGTRPAQKALDKPGNGAAGAGAKPPKKKAKAAKAKAASKPSKHRKGPPKPKAPSSKVKK
ncbi:ribonuclease R [Pseudomonas sp. BN415]|uniref:ribonuclease R n=1 Tax=Pseudomonas sp. BN415 TaxID=2567889 RepID=UPI0024545957|nr:ribonuclease R [Pseudomonas sp. BN415]MDH4583660.1 ribonuclease R [Pseudomonas sp. BN415]